MMNCSRPHSAFGERAGNGSAAFFFPTEWEAVYILGKKSAWDAGGLAAKNTHDGNFFDQGIKKEWLKVGRRGVYLHAT